MPAHDAPTFPESFARTSYAEKKERLVYALRERSAPGSPPGTVHAFGLAKATSNLFRDRASHRQPRVNLAGFDRVIVVDALAGTLDAEGMTTYEALVDATLSHGAMPCVVPQLKTITIGGATVGVGIESTSFRHGLVHESVLEIDVLLADGSVVTCTADNAHADLYFGFPNSYGTLGYALRVKARTLPVRPFVHLANVRHADPEAFFADLATRCESHADFLDGVVFGDREFWLVEGRFVDAAPRTSDYTFERIYYRSIRERDEDWLTTRDYLWRWDTDWFWCSKNVGAQHPLLRRLFGRDRLNSRTYQRIMRWNSRVGLARNVARLSGLHTESVIQDVDLPIERAAEFLAFLRREIGILPVWICPVRAGSGDVVGDRDARDVRDRDTPTAPRWPLFPMRPGTLYVNFGFWDVVRTRESRPVGHFNRLVEEKVIELGGIKSLYSDSYFTREEFGREYGGEAWATLKRKYDPNGAFPTLYEKCVGRR